MDARTPVLRLAIALVVLGALAARPAQAAGISVNSAATGSVAGACTLLDAVAAANTDAAVNGCTAGAGADTITFSVSGTITVTTELTLVSGSTVTVDGTGQTLTISGGGTTRVMNVPSGATLHLLAVTVANGRALTNGTIGGGVAVFSGGTLSVRQSTFANNHAEDGGGIYDSGTVSITDSTFSGNFGRYSGGVSVATSATGNLIVVNSTFSGNSGGGLVNGKTATVVNSTFWNNNGGGILNAGTLNLANTIVASTSGGDCSNTFVSTTGTIVPSGVNLIGDGSCNVTGALTGDPKLGELVDNGGPTPTHALTVASTLVIDAGDPTVCSAYATDQRGVLRAIDGDHDNVATCDLGAVEAAPPTLLARDSSFSATGRYTGFPLAAPIGDLDSLLSALTFTIDGSTSATKNGITVSDLVITPVGIGRGTVEIACGATAATFTLRVTDPQGFSGAEDVRITFTGTSGGAPTLTLPGNIVATLPASPVATGMPVTFTVTATGGCGSAATVTTTPVSGSLFPLGTTTVVATATDVAGNTATGSFTVTVAYPTCGIDVTPAMLTQPYVAMPYVQLLGVNAGAGYTFSITDGTLPPGLQLASAFGKTALIGTPQTPGTYSFTITAAKSGSNCRPSRRYTVTIPPTVVPLLTCVQKINSTTYRATFGYASSMATPLTIPVSTNNYFTPGAQNRGQVTTFGPGTATNAFSVTFTSSRNDNDLAVWFLRGPDNQKRLVTVTKSTYGCQ